MQRRRRIGDRLPASMSLLTALRLEKPAAALLAFHGLLWLAVGLALDIHPDMADHWLWSKHLSWGYYEHPPFVALTMWPVNLFGPKPLLALKLGSILFSLLILYLAYQLARLAVDSRTAVTYLAILEAGIYFSFGSVFWHIDQPFLVFWLLGLLVMVQWVRSQNHNWILLYGLIAGLGGISKYIMLLQPLCLLAWVALCPKARRLPLLWQTWAGAAIAGLVILPNLWWNQQNEWITFQYNFSKGLKGADPLRQFSLMQLGQLLLFSLVFTLAFWWLWARRKLTLLRDLQGGDGGLLLLKITGVFPFLFFAYTSCLGSGSDPHWLNVSYFGFFLFLAHYLTHQNPWPKWVWGLAYGLNFLIVGLVLWQVKANPLNLNEEQNYPFTKVTGWESTASQVQQRMAAWGAPVPPFVISREYHVASSFALYLEAQPWTHTLEKPLRNQWSPVAQVRQQGALLLCPPDECKRSLREAEERLGRMLADLGEIATDQAGKRLRTLHLYYLPPA